MDKKKAKEKRRKRVRKFFKKFPTPVIIMIVLAVASYLFAFLHFETVNISEYESYSIVITDLEYHSNTGRGSRDWATFNASEVPAYYVFESKTATSREFEKLQQLAEEKTKVMVTYTDHKSYTDWNRQLETSGRKRIVDIRSEDDIVFNVDEFNDNMALMSIIWSLIATFFLLFGIAYFIIYVKNDFNKI